MAVCKGGGGEGLGGMERERERERRERERERRVWEEGLGRRPNDAGDLCGSRMGKWASRLLPKVFFFWVELSSGLQRAREFVKAFRERGGDLHSAQRQHREMIFMPPYQFPPTIRVLGDAL